MTHPEPRNPGIWPSQWIQKAVEAGIIDAPDYEERQLQPASLDLTLGDVAYRLRCSFLPGKNDTVEDQLKAFQLGPPIDLSDGAILERNRPYLIPLRERVNLPNAISARANPKSSTGRLDVFTRVVTDRSSRFDDINRGYEGRLYLEVVPRSFAVMVHPGLALNQLRIAKGTVAVTDDDLRAAHRESPLLYRNGKPLGRREVRARGGLWLSLDLMRSDGAVVGYRAKRNSGLIDMARLRAYDPDSYWDFVVPESGNRVILEPEEFYLLLSAEAVRIPPDFAAEMTAFDPSGGEVRTHYAGFFDPGFGHDPTEFFPEGSRAALEVRAHDVPFAVDHLQRVCQLRFERMAEPPDLLYGVDGSSNYQGQVSTLSKHFRTQDRPDQLTFSPARARSVPSRHDEVARPVASTARLPAFD